ncbi:MAG: pucR [Firmicutes bacterium]|nr:pucR [Bacillota bacterium]
MRCIQDSRLCIYLCRYLSKKCRKNCFESISRPSFLYENPGKGGKGRGPMPSLKEIVNLPSLKKMKIVAGRDGLDRIVNWVHFLDLPDVLPWIQGGELLLITGIGLEQDEKRLLDLVEGIAEKHLAGLVINVGPYIKETPDTVIRLADELKFPVFELPWEVKLVEVTHDVSTYIIMKQMEEKSVSDLLENILFNVDCDFAMLIRRAEYYGYDLNKPHQVGIIRVSDFGTVLQDYRDELSLMKLKGRFDRAVRDIINIYYRNALAMFRVDAMIILIPEKTGKKVDKNYNFDTAWNLIASCCKKFPELTLNIGLGSSFTDLRFAKNSYKQARFALKYADFSHSQNGVHRYSDIGVYKLLLDLESRVLEEYFQESLGELIKYDNEHGAELMLTLSEYLKQNCNAVQTAKKLFIHKNTLTYRIRKIERITAKNFSNMQDRVSLQIALIIGEQLDV